MPRHYMYRCNECGHICNECGHIERRYRNSTKCRKCGGNIVRVTTKDGQSTTSGSHPPDTISAEAEELRAALDEQSELLITIARRAAASTTQLAQIRAILTGLLADADIETTDDVVRLAVQVRALVRALEADRAAIVELLLATGVEPASGDPVQLAAQVRELVRELRKEYKEKKK